MRSALFVLALFTATPAFSQWQIVTPAPTTADLRGIDNVGKGIAWASGTDGTVLRTEDDGILWQRCAVPPGAEHLDFRGIQAFDANTAIVMSSGKGDLSRLYKTSDGCQTWKLLLKNFDKDGFWDAIEFETRDHGMLLGDPVHGEFYLAETYDAGKHWTEQYNNGLKADSKIQRVFAASNSSLIGVGYLMPTFGSGGPEGALVYHEDEVTVCLDDCPESELNLDGSRNHWRRAEVPLGDKSEASGLFSLAEGPKRPAPAKGLEPLSPEALVAVGGDYSKPDDQTATSAFSADGGETWTPSATPPHGFRSAVAYDEKSKTWITVGPNGTDISTDDGRNWRALRPGKGEPADADQHWNALSLPFVVGPHGRIGKLRADALNVASQ